MKDGEFSLVGTSNPQSEMASRIAQLAKCDGEYTTAIDGLFIARRSAPTQPVHAAQWPCFALVAQGAKSLKLGTELYRYGVGDCLVVSLDLPVVSRVTEASERTPHLGFGMKIEAESLKAVMGRMDDVRAAISSAGTRGICVHTASTELLDASVRLLRLLDHPKDIPMVAPLIKEEILYRLLTSPFGPQLQQIAMIETPSNKISKAITYLRERFMEPLRIDDLAKRVGMSTSSLHHHFKTVTAMTPVQYQKRIRLHEARRLMVTERLDVGSAGYRVGYQSPSQFSREYSRLYGLSPRRDAEGARHPVAGDVSFSATAG